MNAFALGLGSMDAQGTFAAQLCSVGAMFCGEENCN